MLTLLDVSKPTLVDAMKEFEKSFTLKEKIEIEISFYKMQINIFFNNIIRGVKNIIKYFPVIWRDTPWDFEENFFRILDKKLEVTKKEIYRNSIIVDTPKVYDQISETQAYIYLYLGIDEHFDCENQDLLSKIQQAKGSKKDSLLKKYFTKKYKYENETRKKIYSLLSENAYGWWD